MAAFYFTYGTENQPFAGGWTQVDAPDYDAAVNAFCVYHPKRDGFINCSSIYTEAQFKETSMFLNGNLGKRCHEVIILTRSVMGG